ncbi:MAG TPA: ABC transporter ATP-binding protein [Bacteriovoracaceae bacterium]|nr:ABC transporter ATP-binding protein [Bacteriovoracaceae bacterium]
MIELLNVSKKFDGRGIAGINGLTLTLPRGEILAVMGPNGSGKTTLINVIAGKIIPDSGIVKLDVPAYIFTGGSESQDMNVQKYLILKNTQNIDDEKKLQFARDFADIFEFTFQLKQDLSQLSAGQRQKVELAAILVNRPGLLLLDEPFTHLDPHTRKDILKSLFNYIRQQETSLLWVTHELDEALMFSDRLGLLNFGRFDQIDTPFNLVEKPRSLFSAQFLGYENFLAIKKNSEGWVTPWGIIASPLKTEEALLVIPDDAWIVGHSESNATVTSLTLKGYKKCFRALFEEKEFQVTLPRSKSMPTTGLTINLKADLAECFLIPL